MDGAAPRDRVSPDGPPAADVVADLAADLRGLGLARGDIALVHCSLSRFGRLPDGPATLAAALREVLGPAGTLVVPAQTAGNSVTSGQFRAATAGFTPAQVAAAEAAIDPFDPGHSPTQGMGVLAEYVRTRPGAVRSHHPQVSFAALGARAGELMAVHDLDCHLGERSPLGALFAADAVVVLLGVGYNRCTALHLAEHRLDRPPPRRPYRCYVLAPDGRRLRRDFVAPDLQDADFPQIGAELDGAPFVRTGRVGAASCRLFGMRPAVELAVRWMTRHRRR